MALLFTQSFAMGVSGTPARVSRLISMGFSFSRTGTRTSRARICGCASICQVTMAATSLIAG